ncbi:MAG TPA: STAS domain-containing protein [Gemmatimonadales bacterium]|jgi:anti-anti-sigma regulatory factor|nr:STAS domain-containing protein [Gemmatimonadales bacterium]
MAHSTERVLPAPKTLGLETRGAFRQEAIAVLEQLPEGLGRLILDFEATDRVDSAGLGALMLVQRRAAERRQIVALRNVNDEIRFLLVLTRLVDLFEME